MNPDDAPRETVAATLQFERDLESLLLSAFADGVAIEDEWSVELPVSTAPDWTVEIRKKSPEMDGVTAELDDAAIEPDGVITELDDGKPTHFDD